MRIGILEQIFELFFIGILFYLGVNVKNLFLVEMKIREELPKD
jgi:hypothetical protein